MIISIIDIPNIVKLNLVYSKESHFTHKTLKKVSFNIQFLYFLEDGLLYLLRPAGGTTNHLEKYEKFVKLVGQE